LNSVRSVITALIIFLVGACTQNQLAKDPNLYAVPVNNFSKSVELLISNADFLEEEVMKINAQSPSVQRIIIGADILIKEKEYIKANNELERAFRITNTDSALFLRLAHLRFKQGLLEESESFASKGLLLSDLSSWERLLLNVYLRN
tara:strand:- start:1170 stop:1610 length:441 start_codon:yes stop_codon:yes gene_type:complete